MSDRLLDAVLRNLNWFRSSGVMDPADGRWGVGERVVVMEGNAVADKITEAFYAWTPRDGYCVIEQRRADCNFQAAWLFLRAFEVTGSPEDRATGENLLYYLYQRSGLLMQYEPGTPHGLWQWSHIRSTPIPYFDDNAWCLAIQIAIGKRYPELDKKYKMQERAKVLAEKMCSAMRRSYGYVPEGESRSDLWKDPANVWFGNMYYPHWCSLAIMAMSAAYDLWPQEEWAVEIRRWSEFVDARMEEWNTSELGYAIMGAACAARVMPEKEWFASHLRRLGDRLIARQDPVTGNFASEHDSEAPAGPHLVDTIYTANWVLPALQCLGEQGKDAGEKLLQLLLKIQDTDSAPQFNGCWRGMYDLQTGSWGGGDRYEGGAGSIYTGWTNAPISLWLLAERDGKSLPDMIF